MSLKKLIKRLMLGESSRFSTWICVGHPDPETQVTVKLNGLEDVLDVTRNNVTVELRPLLMGIMLPSEKMYEVKAARRLSLTLHDPVEGDSCFGEVGLSFRESVVLEGFTLALFLTTYCKSRCLSPWRVSSHYLYERVKVFFDRDPRNAQKMKPRYLFSNWLLFSLPHMVSLVSFDDGEHFNMFPMDLIGTTDSPYYLLSLTSYDPSLPHILKGKKIAISYLPIEQGQMTYAMGKHHKKESIARDTLPLPTVLSAEFSIPVPQCALSVREVEIVYHYALEYHTIMFTKVKRFVQWQEGLHMCHIQRMYHQYLFARSRLLPSIEILDG